MGHTHKEPTVSTKEAKVHSGGVILDTSRNRGGNSESTGVWAQPVLTSFPAVGYQGLEGKD